MPNIVSHYLFAKKLYKEITEKDPNSFLAGNMDFLALGTQGPDIMFFTGRAPWDMHSQIAKMDLGNQLHNEDGTLFFPALCQELSTIKEKSEYNAFATYVFGCALHVLLDRETHPFTYYWTGFDKNHLIRHSMIESAYGSNQAISFNEIYLIKKPTLALPYDKRVTSIIDKHLTPVMEKIFHVKLYKDYYRKSLHTYRFVLEFINAPLTKNLAFGQLKALRMHASVSTRCLNLDHKEWLYPSTGEKRTDSFIDLFNSAYAKSENVYHQIESDGFVPKAFSSVMNGLNYEGYKVGGKMIYSSPDCHRTDW